MQTYSLFIFLLSIVNIINCLSYKISNTNKLFKRDIMPVELMSIEEKFSNYIRKLKREDIEKMNSNQQFDLSLVYTTDDYILVGDTFRLLNISIANINDKNYLNKSIIWDKSPKDHERNYLKAAIPLDEENKMLLACGTNGEIPYCKLFTWNDNSSKYEYQKDIKSTTLHDRNFIISSKAKTDETMPPYSYLNSIIYFQLSLNKWSSQIVRHFYEIDDEKKNEFKLLNRVISPRGALIEPRFRHSFPYKDHIYFIYNDCEADYNSNSEFKQCNAYIAQVCENDKGTSSLYEFAYDVKTFSTFKKTILNCYIQDKPADTPILFNQFEQMVQVNDKKNIFYAIFSQKRPSDSYDSAICKFDMLEIEEVFEKSDFRGGARRKPFKSCNEFSSLSKKELLEYNSDIRTLKKYQLDQVASSRVLFTLNNERFTSIAVDTDYVDHIIFVGTYFGRLIKLIMKPVNESQNALTQLDYFELIRAPILNLIISNEKNTLVAVTNGEIRSIPLDMKCKSYTTCSKCLARLDSYCVWSPSESICINKFKNNHENLINNQTLCNKMETNDDQDDENDEEDDDERNNEYSIKIDKIDMSLQSDSKSFYTASGFDEQARKFSSSKEQLRKKNNNNISPIFFSVLITAFLTFFVTVMLTHFILTKYRDKIDKLTVHFHRKSNGGVNGLRKSDNFFISKFNKLKSLCKNNTDNTNNDYDDEEGGVETDPSLKNEINNNRKANFNQYEPVSNIIMNNSGPLSHQILKVSVKHNNNNNNTSTTSAGSPITTASSSLIESNNNSPNNTNNLITKNNNNNNSENSSIDETHVGYSDLKNMLTSSSNASTSSNTEDFGYTNDRYLNQKRNFFSNNNNKPQNSSNLLINEKLNL